MSGSTKVSLMRLAPELVELVLSFLPPRDLVTFGLTCRQARAFVQPSNQVLWRSAFLHLFDDPKIAWASLPSTARTQIQHRERTWDWWRQVRIRCEALHLARRKDKTALLIRLQEVVTTLLDILDTAVKPGPDVESRNLDILERLFQSAPDVEQIVHDYHVDIDTISLPLEFLASFGRPITRSMVIRSAIPPWVSRLHVLYGPTQRELMSVRSKASARGIAYDWSTTGPEADHGPLCKDGSGKINWQTLEAISSLMHRVFESTRAPHSYAGTPWGFRKSVPRCFPPPVPVEGDWAGLSRTWVTTYAFLDYRALVHYNFANRLEHPMDLGQCEEACGDLTRTELTLSTSKELENDLILQSDVPYCTDLPKLYFTGRSDGRRLLITVKGSACLAIGGREVRWRFIIGYGGQDQWHLEGVQPGGIQSGGVYGMWSHVEHEANGPIGPFCYFPLEACEPHGAHVSD